MTTSTSSQRINSKKAYQAKKGHKGHHYYCDESCEKFYTRLLRKSLNDVLQCRNPKAILRIEKIAKPSLVSRSDISCGGVPSRECRGLYGSVIPKLIDEKGPGATCVEPAVVRYNTCAEIVVEADGDVPLRIYVE